MSEKNFIIAGFGGQGVLLAGEVLANAFMFAGKNVTWYPSYGAEMRGGTVNCEVVMSDEEVSEVNKSDADYIILSLGILAKADNIVSLETLNQALDAVIPPHRKNLLPLNIKALKIGYEYDLLPA